MKPRRGGPGAGDTGRFEATVRPAGDRRGAPGPRRPGFQRRRPRPSERPDTEVAYDVEVVPGLEEFVEAELRERLGRPARVLGRPAEGRIAISYAGEPRRLGELRGAIAVYAARTFDVPRPRGLLGHEHVTRLLELIERVVRGCPPGSFTSFRVSAAGADTTVFARLKEEISAATGLPPSEGPGDLLVAVRRAPFGQPGWQVLARLGTRPLSARPWRVCNLPGALNATVAHVMVELAGPTPVERFLNLACGSGTLMIERRALGPAGRVVGADVAPAALRCARANLGASGYARDADLVAADAARLPFPAEAFDTIVADLPFGMLVGSGAENARLYPRLVTEASRVAAPGAALVVITAARRLFEGVMDNFRRGWARERVVPIKLPYEKGYLRPSIYVFRRVLI